MSEEKPQTELSMTEAEFKTQLKLRGEEYKEYENMIQAYLRRIRSVPGMLKGPMVMSFRAGVISMLDLLDNKAKLSRYERDLKKLVSSAFRQEPVKPVFNDQEILGELQNLKEKGTRYE